MEETESILLFISGQEFLIFTGLATNFIGEDFVEDGKKGFEEMGLILTKRAGRVSYKTPPK